MMSVYRESVIHQRIQLSRFQRMFRWFWLWIKRCPRCRAKIKRQDRMLVELSIDSHRLYTCESCGYNRYEKRQLVLYGECRSYDEFEVVPIHR